MRATGPFEVAMQSLIQHPLTRHDFRRCHAGRFPVAVAVLLLAVS